MKLITAVVRPFMLDELRNAIAAAALEAIANVARTGRAGDGHITIGDLDEVIRIRTGEIGTSAT